MLDDTRTIHTLRNINLEASITESNAAYSPVNMQEGPIPGKGERRDYPTSNGSRPKGQSFKRLKQKLAKGSQSF